MDKFEAFLDIEKHLINDEVPSRYLNELLNEGTLSKEPFDILGDLRRIEQEKKFHPEGSVWNHTMLVLDEAAKRRELSEDSRSFMWAALLHDIGKGKTTVKRKGRWTSYDHDSVGAEMTRRFLRDFSSDESFNDRVVALVRWHMQNLYVANRLPFAKISNMLEECPVREITLLSLCDRFGRGKINEEDKEEVIEKLEKFVDTLSRTSGENYQEVKDNILHGEIQKV